MNDESSRVGVGAFLVVLTTVLTLIAFALVLTNKNFRDDPYGYHSSFYSYSWIRNLEPEQRAIQYQQVVNKVNILNYVVLSYMGDSNSANQNDVITRKLNRCNKMLSLYFSLVRHESRHWIRMHGLPLRSEIACVT